MSHASPSSPVTAVPSMTPSASDDLPDSVLVAPGIWEPTKVLFPMEFSIRTLLFGQREHNARMLERRFFYGPRRITAQLCAPALIAVYFLMAIIFGPASGRTAHGIGLGISVMTVIIVALDFWWLNLWEKDSGLSMRIKEVTMVVWMYASFGCVMAGRAQGLTSCPSDYVNDRYTAARCGRFAVCGVVALTEFVAALRILMPRWCFLLVALALPVAAAAMFSTDTMHYAGESARLASLGFIVVTSALVVVGMWLDSRWCLEAYAEADRSRRAHNVLARRVQLEVPRLVPTTAAVETAHWSGGWTLHSAVDSLLLLGQVSEHSLLDETNGIQTATAMWQLTDAVVSLMNQMLLLPDGTAGRKNVRTSDLSRWSGVLGDMFFVCIHNDLTGVNAASSLQQDTASRSNHSMTRELRWLIKVALRLNDTIKRTIESKLRISDCARMILHRGFVASATIGRQLLQEEPFGTAWIEAKQCLAQCSNGDVYATATVTQATKEEMVKSLVATASLHTNPIPIEIFRISQPQHESILAKANAASLADEDPALALLVDESKSFHAKEKTVTIVTTTERLDNDHRLYYKGGPLASDMMQASDYDVMSNLLEIGNRHKLFSQLEATVSYHEYERKLDGWLSSRTLPRWYSFQQSDEVLGSALEQTFVWTRDQSTYMTRGVVLIACALLSSTLTGLIAVLLNSVTYPVATLSLACVATAADMIVLILHRRHRVIHWRWFNATLSTLSLSCTIAALILATDKSAPSAIGYALLRLVCFDISVARTPMAFRWVVAFVCVLAPIYLMEIVTNGTLSASVLSTFAPCWLLGLVVSFHYETDARRAYCRIRLIQVAAEESSSVIRVEQLCKSYSCGKTLAEDVLRRGLKISAPVMSFPTSVILVVKMPQLHYVNRMGYQRGLVALHTVRSQLDAIATAYGAERIDTYSGDILGYADLYADLVTPELSLRRIKGSLMVNPIEYRTNDGGEEPSGKRDVTVCQKMRFLIEMWFSMHRCLSELTQRGSEGSRGASNLAETNTSLRGMMSGGSNGLRAPYSSTSLIGDASATSHPGAVGDVFEHDARTPFCGALSFGAVSCGFIAAGPKKLCPHFSGPPIINALALAKGDTEAGPTLRIHSDVAAAVLPPGVREASILILTKLQRKTHRHPHAGPSATSAGEFESVACRFGASDVAGNLHVVVTTAAISSTTGSGSAVTEGIIATSTVEGHGVLRNDREIT